MAEQPCNVDYLTAIRPILHDRTDHWTYSKHLPYRVIVTDTSCGGNHHVRHLQWRANDVRKAKKNN